MSVKRDFICPVCHDSITIKKHGKKRATWECGKCNITVEGKSIRGVRKKIYETYLPERIKKYGPGIFLRFLERLGKKSDWDIETVIDKDEVILFAKSKVNGRTYYRMEKGSIFSMSGKEYQPDPETINEMRFVVAWNDTRFYQKDTNLSDK